MSSNVRCSRLWAATAIIVALLAPGVAAAATGTEGPECDGIQFDLTDPQHYLYGASQGTAVDASGKMVVDLVGMAPGRVVFWDGGFSKGSDGAVIIGTDDDDVICGTTGDDQIWGRKGDDRIFGFGSRFQYDNARVVVDGATTCPGCSLGDHLFGNRGNDLVVNGKGEGLSHLAYDAALVGGGRGNDVLYSGNAEEGTTWVRGGRGNDHLLGGLSGRGQVLEGGAGDDTIDLWGLDDSVADGNAGDDILSSKWGNRNRLDGNTGADTLDPGWGDGLRLNGDPDGSALPGRRS